MCPLRNRRALSEETELSAYLTQGLHRTLQQKPDHMATRYCGRQTTFGELGDRVARLAAALQAQGVQEGDRIAMLSQNSDRYLEYLLATWWAGAVINPVNTRWSTPEIAYSLNDCSSRVLIVDDTFLDRALELQAQSPSVSTLIHVGDRETPAGLLSWETLVASHGPIPDVRAGGSTLAAILYTGGTTGHPKGVMVSHDNLWSAAVARLGQSNSPPEGVSLLLTPFFHVAGLGRLIIQVIMGQSSVILPRFEPELVLRAIQDEGVDEVGMVPSMLQMVLDHPSFGEYDLSGLKRVGYGASPMTLALLERVMAALPGVEFTHSYGMTETAAVVTVSGPENHTAWGREKGLVRSAGRAGYSSEVRILDGDGREVPPGTVGEIVIRGPSIMQGYWNKPAETEAALRDGWLHTGDGGYLDAQGHLFIVDRIKDMIITGGENVYSAEVESVLARHPAVRECAVIGIPHEQWGEAVHAIVTTHPGQTVDALALREHCRQFLAGYKCPKTVDVRESLPMSAAGKILKQVLRKEHGQGAAGVHEKAAAG